MKLLVAGNISKNIADSLRTHGFELAFTKPDSNLLDGLWFHPDMQMSRYSDTVVCNPAMYEIYREFPDFFGVNFVPGNKVCRCNYPDDIAYNIKVAGNNVFHNFRYTDSVLNELVSGLNRIDVSQGYSGCSICAVNENAIITSDVGIHRNAIIHGVDSLIIKPGYIELEKFDYGFIGGASFTCNDKVYFFGDITAHPDYLLIADFCSGHNREIVSLSGGKLTDFGSAITLD